MKYSRTSRKRTPSGPRVSVRLREVSAYGRLKKKCTRGHILHQLRQLVIVFQGVDRPNTTPIGQERKFKDLDPFSIWNG